MANDQRLVALDELLAVAAGGAAVVEGSATDLAREAYEATKEQFDALAAAGVQRVLHLRRKSEQGTGWEEARAAEAGVRFERLEIAGGPGLTRENVEAFAKLLASYGDDKILVSCASSNRVGAMFALKAVWLEGADKEAAMALGKRAGMKRLSLTVEKLLRK